MGPVVGYSADTQIRAEDFTDRNEHGVAGLDAAGLDPGKEAVIDPGSGRERANRQASVDPKRA